MSTAFPDLIDLAALGAAGFKIQGESAGDQAGFSVAAAGDVDGDGIADLIVGAYRGNGTAGAAYVVFGRDATQSFPALIDLGDVAQGTGGFEIRGQNAGDLAGFSVSSAGDVNGDGLADLVVGAIGDDSGGYDAGAAYVVLGNDQGFTSPVDLATIAQGTGGFAILGEHEGNQTGKSVSAAGDINGDGIDDLIVGAPGDSSAGDYAGAAYVVFGNDQGFASPVDLDEVAQGMGGFKIQSENADDSAGIAVSAAGDVNGDGIDDLVVGAPYADGDGHDAGAAYVMFGDAQGFAALIGLDDVARGTGGFEVRGESADDRAGWSVSAAGDVNGDGWADVIVGAPFNDGSGNDAGAAYVVFGSDQGFTSPVDLAAIAQGTGGFEIRGEGANDRAGWSVSAAGDVNGDGLADLIVGATGNGDGAGAAYVVFGHDSTGAGRGFTSPVDLADVAQGMGGFKIQGENLGDSAGFSVSAAGDVNGDGIDDLIVGAPFNGSGGSEAGAAYVIYGQVTTNEPPVAQDDSAQTAILTPVTVDVLANDSDPDGTLAPTTVTITDDPANGTATANPDGTVTYLPDFLFIGEDSFAYTVEDNGGAVSNAATVSVAVGAELNVITGTESADTRHGTGGADFIQVLGGNDLVFAWGDDDIVLGGAGHDGLAGNAGNDLVMGGSGNDTLVGGPGLDILVGGPGNDGLLGGADLDVAIFAGAFADHRVITFGGSVSTVQDLAGDGGKDTLCATELLQFDDGVFDARNGSFTPDAYATPAVEVLVTSPGFTTDPEPILAPVA